MTPQEWIQRRLGLVFDDPGLLIEALTHPSYLNENPGKGAASYQRLEFLGDAVLGFITASELFRRFPDQSEGGLTQMRAHLVQERTLAYVARELGLGEQLRLGRGEEANGGRLRESNLAASIEALAGAVYMDRGVGAARSVVLEMLAGVLEEVEQPGGPPPDPKSRLQELVQARHGDLPQYRVAETGGPDHSPTFTVEVWLNGERAGVGEARRKLDAERAAATQAIDALAAAGPVEA